MAQYVDILGHPTWVDDDGSDRRPLLMLHGGLTGSHSWGEFAPFLAQRHRLIMFDRRGHGRTSDTDEPFHYETMARETAAVIEALNLAPVHVVGFSDGGNILLHLALDRPELLGAMVLLSANYHHDALEPAAAEGVEQLALPGNVLEQAYASVSPDGAEHWPVVAAKGLRMAVREEPTFGPNDLTAITTPTLVLAGDDDQTAGSHAVSLYDALPNAQLAIVPNTSHLLIYEKPALTAQLVNEFFDQAERADTLLPTRRPPRS